VENRVRFKIGEIEFEAEGSAEIIERERSEFMSKLLPAAVDAIVRTHGAEQRTQYIDAQESPALLAEETTVAPIMPEPKSDVTPTDLSRTNLASFIKNYGVLNDQDFTLIAANYNEKKYGTSFFTSESIKNYYAEARRSEYSNRSELIYQLAKKGYIMDNPSANGKLPKQYILTTEGIAYVETYKPKEESGEKKKASSKQKKTGSTMNLSIYKGLNLDELNLKSYPEVKSLNTFKKRMFLVMYIVTSEGKGEFFSVTDIQYLMTDLLGLPATIGQINGIFKKNRAWFKSEHNKKAVRRKLLEGGKDFAKGIIDTLAVNDTSDLKQ
jgi:hypothetical protein